MGYENKKNDAFAVVESFVGCKWSLRVVDAIRHGHKRPSEIKKAISGISEKVMNERLKKLLRYELIVRTVYPVTPPKVEYKFSAKGRQFLKVIDSIERFSEA